jgi:hypothetical protein
MRPAIAIILALLLFSGVAVLGWVFWAGRPAPRAVPPVPNAKSSTLQSRFTESQGVEQRYVNTTYGFSFAIPEGFLAGEKDTSTPGGQLVLVYSDTSSTSALLVVTPAKDPPAFSQATVESIVPGIQVAYPTPVTVRDGLYGLAFESESTYWQGPSSELWFNRDGVRYQLSTRLVDADLLTFIWNSWHWR